MVSETELKKISYRIQKKISKMKVEHVSRVVILGSNVQ